MSGHHRTVVASLVLGAIAFGFILVGFAASACPVDTPAQSCPDATRNLVVAVVLAALATTLFVTPFAFLAEFVARRRIVFRGAWWRASRRGVLAGLTLAAIAGLRLGGALTVPVAIFVAVLAIIVDRFLATRDTV